MALDRYRVAGIAALVLMFALMAQNALGLPYQPRFVVRALNFWAVALTFLAIPVAAFWLARALPDGWQRRLDLATAIVLLFPCIAVAIWMLSAAPAPERSDAPDVLADQVQAGSSFYRLYHAGCALRCRAALELRQEWPLAAGVKLVTPRWSGHDADLVRLEMDASTVRVFHRADVLGEVPR